ncbi:MAG TPA: GDSL-type esterase/lipase family protein [Spongiibacteraceae bacterium]
MILIVVIACAITIGFGLGIMAPHFYHAVKWLGLKNPPDFTYQQLHAIYQRKDLQHTDRTVLLLGDSHVHALCEGCLDRRALNFGIGGDTVAGLRRRLADYPSIQDASNIAVVEIGANDLLWERTEDLAGQFSQLLDELDRVGYIFVYGVFPVAKTSGKSADNARIAAFNVALEQVCKTHKNCTFAELRSLYSEDGNLKEELHIGDGIHLNASGYQAWIKDLHAQLAKCRIEATAVVCQQ